MGLKEAIMELLHAGDTATLSVMASDDRRAFRLLLGRLWDTDADVRERAARTVGRVAALRPELGIEVVRRLVWALNDESGTNGIHGIAALAAIGVERPQLLEAHLGAIIDLLADPGLRAEIVGALEVLAQARPSLLDAHRADLRIWQVTLDEESGRRLAALLAPREGRLS